MLERRHFLRTGLAAAPIAVLAGFSLKGALPAMAASADPIPGLFARAQALRDYINNDAVHRSDVSDEQLDALLDRIGDMERRAAATPPTTVAGAIAALDWAVFERAEAGHWGERRDDFIGDMLSSLSVFLRTLAEGGAA